MKSKYYKSKIKAIRKKFSQLLGFVSGEHNIIGGGTSSTILEI